MKTLSLSSLGLLVCLLLVILSSHAAVMFPLSGKYCVAFDPLDGSSNIDCNVSTGTIFSVWEKVSLLYGSFVKIFFFISVCRFPKDQRLSLIFFDLEMR